jgi:hypothetical protein
MASELSRQNEQYLEQLVTGGLYPSKEAAVAALREKNDEIPFVPDEHMEAVEQGIAEADAGLTRPMTEHDWDSLRQLARDCSGS